MIKTLAVFCIIVIFGKSRAFQHFHQSYSTPKWQWKRHQPLVPVLKADLNDRVVILETEMLGIKKELTEIKNENRETKKELKELIKESNESLSKEIKDLSKEIKDLSKETKESIASLSKEIKDLNNKFTPIYVFMAVFTTATVMANFKDFAAFFK